MLQTEYLLIHKLLETKEIPTVEKLKITPNFFSSDECGKAYKYLLDHYRNKNTYGHLPSWDLFNQQFPGFPPPPPYVEDSLETLCEDVRKKFMLAEQGKIIEKLSYYIQAGKPYDGYNFIRQASMQLCYEHEVSDDLPLDKSSELIMERYLKAKENEGCLGTPWIWESLNKITGGKQKGHYILWRGKTKIGKSLNAIADAVNAWQNFNERILYFSLEMPNIQVNEVAACYLAKVSYAKFCNGSFNPAELEAFKSALNYMCNNPDRWLTTSGEGRTSIASLIAKIREFNPDGLYIDTGLQLVDDTKNKIDNDWKTLLHISRELKQMQKNLKKSSPIRDFYQVVIVQADANDGIALAKYIAQDCDVSIVLKYQYDTVINKEYREVEVDFIRKGKPGKFYIDFEPGISCAEREPAEERNVDIGNANRTKNGPPKNLFNFGTK